VTYLVKEVFYTLQGEGMNTGRPAVFCRFSGCNLWTGHEHHRQGAICRFCDTDFVGTDGPGGGHFCDPATLADHVASAWVTEQGQPFVVCTGGEPLLQLDGPLVDALHDRGLVVAVETNGTVALPASERPIDWVCVSPKAGAELVLTRGNELKLVYPQAGAPPEQFEQLGFDHFLLQPMDGPDRESATLQAITYCKQRPLWRLSLQTHKFLGIP